MSHSCAEPGSLSSRMSSATVSLRSPFLLLGEHEVDGEDPQPSAGTRDSHNCDFSPALLRWTFRVPWGITPVSSKVPTEVAAAVVPVVWASGTAGEWKRAEPVGENLESGQEEKKPRDSSLSPSQPLNCLPGNGGTGWTLDCSLWMCGSPLRNCRNSWCRLGRWIGRPSPSVPAQPLGPCRVVALPALQGKWEGPFQVWWITFIAVGWSLETPES
ncbi:uncharacterized protein LOC135416638 [Pseudopipra pipra]|uniref:uncharacterized protein LOC135416638 n=1 Tax=Pseudopipra pipra TaxID=415032 RepID=UPI003138D3BF